MREISGSPGRGLPHFTLWPGTSFSPPGEAACLGGWPRGLGKRRLGTRTCRLSSKHCSGHWARRPLTPCQRALPSTPRRHLPCRTEQGRPQVLVEAASSVPRCSGRGRLPQLSSWPSHSAQCCGCALLMVRPRLPRRERHSACRTPRLRCTRLPRCRCCTLPMLEVRTAQSLTAGLRRHPMMDLPWARALPAQLTAWLCSHPNDGLSLGKDNTI